MPKYLSGRAKRVPQDQLSEDRYQYLGLDQAEPNLSDPLVSPSVPSGAQYQLVAVPAFPVILPVILLLNVIEPVIVVSKLTVIVSVVALLIFILVPPNTFLLLNINTLVILVSVILGKKAL